MAFRAPDEASRLQWARRLVLSSLAELREALRSRRRADETTSSPSKVVRHTSRHG